MAVVVGFHMSRWRGVRPGAAMTAAAAESSARTCRGNADFLVSILDRGRLFSGVLTLSLFYVIIMNEDYVSAV